MHSYTVNDVLADGFDLSLLNIEDAEYERIKKVFPAIRAKLEAEKKAAATRSGQNPQYVYVNDNEVLQAQQVLTNHHYLSMAFSASAMAKISKMVYGDNAGNRTWVSWAVSTLINNWVMINSSLAKKIILAPSADESVKSFISDKSIVPIDVLVEFVKNGSINSFPEHMQMKLLEVLNPEDCKTFLNSNCDKVKLFAYKKLGPLNHLDDLISDPHAMIRSYAISIISPGDKRLAGFIDDRSEYIFCEALSKISSEHIPMMLGSRHLKKKRAKGILNQRLAG
jgi:hypothetical protein